jgi:hypothetical protein
MGNALGAGMGTSEMLNALLQGGYFPDVMPPCFGTKSYGEAFHGDRTQPAEFADPQARGVPRSSHAGSYFQPRAGGRNRRFSIPNPVHYYRLASCIAGSWPTIAAAARKSGMSMTKPVAATGRHCFHPEVPFAERPLRRMALRSTARFILKADIAKFFPSVYTHSIAWAFHGKAAAKRSRTDKTLLGNQIDSCFQALQDMQTMGIPVGQDISRVIAEVILADVESRIKLPRGAVGIRSIDDYEVGFLSEPEAMKFRHDLERELAAYELELNPLKTSVLALPQVLLDTWDAELRSIRPRGTYSPFDNLFDTESSEGKSPWIASDAYTGKENHLMLFINKALELQCRHPLENVIQFSLTRLAKLGVDPNCWSTYQDYLFYCALNHPESLKVVSESLVKFRRAGIHQLDTSRLKTVLDAIVGQEARLGRSHSVSWALWTALVFNIRLSAEATKSVMATQDAATACLAFEMHRRSLLAKRCDLTAISELVKSNDLYSEHWLLVYEAESRRWSPVSGRVDSDPCFSYLKANGVDFFDSDLIDTAREALERKETPKQRLADLGDDPSVSDSDDEFDAWWHR